RFVVDGRAQFGIIEGSRIVPCVGDPFAGLVPQASSLALQDVTMLTPVVPPNIICLGLNYKKHADEIKMAYPSEPLMFMKATTSIIGPNESIVLPAAYQESIDYEAELAIVIGKLAKNVSAREADSVILGYTIANDVSNRAVQFSDGQWARAKSYDTFCPLGPAIVTGLDGDALDIACRLDGRVLQASNTSDMIFSCRRIVSHLSHCMTLLPGTVILTGTPEGVGFKRDPAVYLRPGQILETEIAGIGVLRNPVVAPNTSE
ncbi:MAG TPA: fumarylacetoacetate hydrolase family protein, partial [Dissulfurispiraceae bacterium]|nr:fumarylacetoacetate hydrolase family protein [Dissulfurispiraceae bacterium]